MILNFLLIAVIWVIILDLTDFPDHIKAWISSILTKGKIHSTNYELKPWLCSLCMDFWTSIIYIIVTNQFTLVNIMLALLIAWSTPIIKDILILINTAIETGINKLMKLIYGDSTQE